MALVFTFQSLRNLAGSAGVRFPRALSGLIAYTAILLVAAAANAQDRPNLIIFMTDDHGIDAVEGPWWPNDLDCHTPRIAQLASQGRVFTHTRVNGYCSPSRAAFLTGRSSIRTGVTGLIALANPMPDRNLVSLQGEERTIAEALSDAGYYTVLVDKWHVGWDASQRPQAQGFDSYFNYDDTADLDDPIEVGDEHISLAVDWTVNEILTRPDPNQPYALFFWSVDPHKRNDHSGREQFGWWRVHESLLPSGEDYYAPERESNRNRYRAVVEAIDTEFYRLMNELDVVEGGAYRDESNTVLFFLGDNGSPREVAPRPDYAKGSPYEGGVRVPCFVFGERVPGDGVGDDSLISHVDFFDTIADVAGLPNEQRSDVAREGISFAGRIGWSKEQPHAREFTISSVSPPEPPTHLVALADHNYKLIVRTGEPGFGLLDQDEFYDLVNDPAELVNLNAEGMNGGQSDAYRRMRDAIVDYWPSIVGEPLPDQIDIPLTHVGSISSDDALTRSSPYAVGHAYPGGESAIEHRLLVRFDIEQIEALLPPGRSFDEVAYAQLILGFHSDSPAEDEGVSGDIRVFPMKREWYERRPRWDRVVDSTHHLEVGAFAPPPHVLVAPRGGRLSGVPLPIGAPVSFGRHDDMLRLVRFWRENPDRNFGVVLVADALSLPGIDQSIRFNGDAVIRLTLSPL